MRSTPPAQKPKPRENQNPYIFIFLAFPKKKIVYFLLDNMSLTGAYYATSKHTAVIGGSN